MLFCVWIVAGAVAFAQSSDPDMSVTPSTWSFGSVCVNTSAPAKTVTVSNDEPDNGSGQTIELSKKQTGSSAFQDTGFSPTGPLAPQETATFTVSFTPAGRGTHTGTFTVTGVDQSDPNLKTSQSVDVSGTGIDRKISATSSTVAFGDQRVGTRSPTKTLIVNNQGGDTLTVTSVKKVGVNPSDFVLGALTQPFTISPGAIKAIGLAFQPTAGGLRKATLEIASNACGVPKLNVALVGTGVLPNVDVEPNPIEVGTSSVGKKGKPTAVTVANNGQAQLTITAIQIIGTDAPDFALSNLPVFPKTLEPEESFVFSIRMTPTEEGLRLATINVLSDDPDVPTFAVAVRGSATAASPSPSASASPSASVSTGPTPTGSQSPRAPGERSNDSLAIFLVVGGVLSAFVGLIVVRRILRASDDDF